VIPVLTSKVKNKTQRGGQMDRTAQMDTGNSARILQLQQMNQKTTAGERQMNRKTAAPDEHDCNGRCTERQWQTGETAWADETDDVICTSTAAVADEPDDLQTQTRTCV